MTSFDPARLAALTFDCYGTLIDWEAGTMRPCVPCCPGTASRCRTIEVIAACQELEAASASRPTGSYKEVLAGVVEGFGRRFNFPVGATERDLLAASVPSWRPFPDTVDALRALGGRTGSP